MGFNTPGFSPNPSPDDWAELEARRLERTQRAHNPHGREMSPTVRRGLQLLFIGLAIAMVVLAILGILGVIEVPGMYRYVD